MKRVQTRDGEMFEVLPVLGVLSVFEVRSFVNKTRIGFIQASPFCLIPSRGSITAREVLEEVLMHAVKLGLVPRRSRSP